ncbi:MAG TPA: hypothetical protein VIK48_07100, partial [Candidatus Manganitrophaceae bacterium]
SPAFDPPLSKMFYSSTNRLIAQIGAARRASHSERPMRYRLFEKKGLFHQEKGGRESMNAPGRAAD